MGDMGVKYLLTLVCTGSLPVCWLIFVIYLICKQARKDEKENDEHR